MQLKRIMSGLLAAVICLAVLSCTTANKSSETGDETESDTSTQAETETQASFDVPEDLDYDGYTFRIMTNPGETEKTAYIVTNWGVDEDTGDVLDTAFYNRNLWLEDYFNMTIEMDLKGGLTDTSRFSRSVNSGEQFDLGIWIDRYALSLAQGGYVRPYTQLDYIDLSKPWWYQKLNKQLSLDNKLYMAAGYQDIGIYACTQALLYNTQIATDLGLGSLYDYVDNGTWTMDKMYDMEVAATKDLNGDGEMVDKDDQWGAVYTGSMWFGSFYSVNNAGFIMKDNDDMPFIAALSDERLYDILYKLVVYLQDKDISYDMNDKSSFAGDHIYENTVKMFNAGHTLFCGIMLSYLNYLREMENYGIMPFPKYEEVDAGTVYDGYSVCTLFYIVPKSHTQPEIPGAVLEAMAYKSYEIVSPAYLETVLSVKQTRDEKSGEIVKMINANVHRDLIHAYWMDQLWANVSNSIKDDMTSFTSVWTKGQKICDSTMEKTIEAFQTMNEGY